MIYQPIIISYRYDIIYYWHIADVIIVVGDWL